MVKVSNLPMEQEEKKLKIVDARSVANEVIRLALAEDAPITHLDVQKLIYFSHGFRLGIQGRPLFYQPVIAWKFGPVVLDVYYALNHNGAQVIRSPIQMPGLQLVDQDTGDGIGYTYRLMGHKSTSRLVAISHDVNGPWHRVWNNSLGQDQIIPNDLIEEYFSGLLRSG